MPAVDAISDVADHLFEAIESSDIAMIQQLDQYFDPAEAAPLPESTDSPRR